MEKIKERAEFNYPYISEDWLSSVQEVTAKELIDTQRESYIIGATEQRQIDHSEEHLHWIIDQYEEWIDRNDGCVEKTRMSFEQWIRKAMEE